MFAVNPVQGALHAWDEEPAQHAELRARPEPPRLIYAAPDDRQSHRGVILEREWREPPEETRGNSTVPRIIVRRWKDESPGVRQHSRDGDRNFAVVAIALRATVARLSTGERCVHDGKMPAGMAVATGAGSSCRVEFSGACDMIHLFVPRERLSQMASGTAGEPTLESPDRICVSPADPVIERLAWLLLKAGDHEGCSPDIYLDGIATAIVTRLVDYSRSNESPTSRQGLVKWRLKRVQDLIESQLSEPLSLRDLARCAGLSRMHFAAQFRAATGMRPHEYLIRQRIQRAQEMLLTTSLPLVEVALSVGFQTQAHFTTVFRRLLGETPGRWREAQLFC